MNRKKWIGAVLSANIVAGATQNFASCDDIISILIKNGFQDLADMADASFRSTIYATISEKIAEHIEKDGKIAGEVKKIKKRFENTGDRRGNSERMKKDNKITGEVKKIKKRCSDNEKDGQKLEDNGNIENTGNRRGNKDIRDLKKEEKENIDNMKKKYEMIEELLNITVRHRECFYGSAIAVDHNLVTPGGEEMINSNRESIAFCEDKEKCEKLMNINEERTKYFEDYNEYSIKMQEYEEDLENCLTEYKSGRKMRIDVEKKFSEIVEKAKKTIEDYYSKPTAYTRFLTKMDFSPNLSFLPNESTVQKLDRKMRYVLTLANKTAIKFIFNLATSIVCDRTTPLLYPIKAFADPYVNHKIDNLVDKWCCCNYLAEYDPHIKSIRPADETKYDNNFCSSPYFKKTAATLFGIVIDNTVGRFPLIKDIPLLSVTDFWNALPSFSCCKNTHKRLSKKMSECFEKSLDEPKDPAKLPALTLDEYHIDI